MTRKDSDMDRDAMVNTIEYKALPALKVSGVGKLEIQRNQELHNGLPAYSNSENLFKSTKLPPLQSNFDNIPLAKKKKKKKKKIKSLGMNNIKNNNEIKPDHDSKPEFIENRRVADVTSVKPASTDYNLRYANSGNTAAVNNGVSWNSYPSTSTPNTTFEQTNETSDGKELVNWISNASTTFNMKNHHDNTQNFYVPQISSTTVISDDTDVKPDYRKIALDIARGPIRVKQRYCDFVLVYDLHSHDIYKINERSSFETALQEGGVDVVRTTLDSLVFVELYASFERLCKEAESIFLNMDLEGCKLEERPSIWDRFFKSMKTDNQVDRISAPFSCSSKEMFYGFENERTFFRSAYRSMLVKNIMKNIKIYSTQDGVTGNDTPSIAGIDSLLHSGSYKSAFILHDRSAYDTEFPLKNTKSCVDYIDSRKELHDAWLKCLKWQPLWKIRNYFGEKIALYFAWLGVLITSLWIPTILGVAVFIYGIISVDSSGEVFTVESFKSLMTKALDNDTTPYFALIICLWGTVFLEVWNRKNAELAYLWDVDTFEEQEPNRPQYFGTRLVKDPLTGLYEPYYPLWRRVLKSMGSYGIVLFMVGMVVTSVISVVIYKIVSRVDWFSALPAGSLASLVTASILNSISILILGRFYKWLAYKLTDWENHQTSTRYEDSLIMKLFGFQFVNSYCSLFYIAFFRAQTVDDGLLGLGSKYTDMCGNNDCMAELTMQVAVLMIMKPMPKFLIDIVIPFFRKYISTCYCCNSSQVFVYDDKEMFDEELVAKRYLQEEYKKPALEDFTLTEYTEKVLQYGYLMLFAAAFPLAPLIALITNVIDLRVDGRRMLWFNQRPVSERAQDIGMWFKILSFLNYAGMITNAFILGIVSRTGRYYQSREITVNSTIFQDMGMQQNISENVNSTTSPITTATINVNIYAHVWIILIFENIVLAVKLFLEYAIPDVPESVIKSRNEEQYQLELLIAKSGFKVGQGMTIQSPKNDGKAVVVNDSKLIKSVKMKNLCKQKTSSKKLFV